LRGAPAGAVPGGGCAAAVPADAGLAGGESAPPENRRGHDALRRQLAGAGAEPRAAGAGRVRRRTAAGVLHRRRRPGMSAALRKCPPHSLEAEQSTLGGLLLDNRAWHELAGQLREEDFYLRRHRLVWRAIGELLRREQPCDFVTVAEHLRQRGELEEAGGLAGLGALAVDTPSAAIVRERAALRGLIAAGQDIAGLGWQPEGRAADLLLEAAQGRLAQVGRTR